MTPTFSYVGTEITTETKYGSWVLYFTDMVGNTDALFLQNFVRQYQTKEVIKKIPTDEDVIECCTCISVFLRLWNS